MKIINIITLFLLVSCGSHKINNNLRSENDAFADESFMRFGNTRLSKVSEKDFLAKSLSKCYKGNFKSTLNDMQKEIKSYKNNSKYWLYIGICYQLYGSQLKANYFYDYALSGSNLIKASVYNNKALVALKSNNFEGAQILLEKAIKLSPKSNIPKYNLAQVYIKFNHLEKAKDLINPLVNKNSNDIDLIFS
uniref:tetratricopeptide repeat protein n=1 Tax=Halobacteriovorax sp. TaxID=2020862 RepID=UPI003565E511